MKNLIDYIFVDLDGTLLDTKQRHYTCYRDIILADGGIPIDIDLYWSLKREKVELHKLLVASKFNGRNTSFSEQWIKCIEEKQYLQLDKVKPFVSETLKIWKTIAKRIVLVTRRKNKKNLLWQMNELQINSRFDEVICCDEYINKSKYEALKTFSFQSAVFIGDTEEDMETAQRLGVPSVAVLSGIRTGRYLEADCYVEEVHNLTISDLEYLLRSQAVE